MFRLIQSRTQHNLPWNYGQFGPSTKSFPYWCYQRYVLSDLKSYYYKFLSWVHCVFLVCVRCFTSGERMDRRVSTRKKIPNRRLRFDEVCNFFMLMGYVTSEPIVFTSKPLRRIFWNWCTVVLGQRGSRVQSDVPPCSFLSLIVHPR